MFTVAKMQAKALMYKQQGNAPGIWDSTDFFGRRPYSHGYGLPGLHLWVGVRAE